MRFLSPFGADDSFFLPAKGVLNGHFHKKSSVADSLFVFSDLVGFYGTTEEASNLTEALDSPIFDIQCRELNPNGQGPNGFGLEIHPLTSIGLLSKK